MALSVPLSRFASRVGGGSAFFVRLHERNHHILNLRFRTWSNLFDFWLCSREAKDIESFTDYRHSFDPHSDDFIVDAFRGMQTCSQAYVIL